MNCRSQYHSSCLLPARNNWGNGQAGPSSWRSLYTFAESCKINGQIAAINIPNITAFSDETRMDARTHSESRRRAELVTGGRARGHSRRDGGPPPSTGQPGKDSGFRAVTYSVTSRHGDGPKRQGKDAAVCPRRLHGKATAAHNAAVSFRPFLADYFQKGPRRST